MKSVTAKKRKVITEEDYLTKESESVNDEVEDIDDEDPEKDTMIKVNFCFQQIYQILKLY